MIGINLVATGSNKFQIITKLYTRLLTLIMLNIFLHSKFLPVNPLSLFHINRMIVWPCNLLQASGRAADRRQNCIPQVDFH